jgi:hypothetical protein
LPRLASCAFFRPSIAINLPMPPDPCLSPAADYTAG